MCLDGSRSAHLSERAGHFPPLGTFKGKVKVAKLNKKNLCFWRHNFDFKSYKKVSFICPSKKKKKNKEIEKEEAEKNEEKKE